MSPVPDKPSIDGIEARWSEAWEAQGTYRFDRRRDRSEVYAIDTPPPTVSGSLHMGSVFGYVQTDAVARFWRMRGREVFYPMGWDDNGLPTERRVENHFGVRCDPSLSYDPGFEPPAQPDPKAKVSCSRPNFVELCLRLTAEDEQVFEQVWRRTGLSVDWALTYTTIGRRAQRISQRAFLRNLARGEAYAAEAPSLWDVTYQTAVAQAEIEDREQPGAYHRYGFTGAGGKVFIETTRPELLPACVALVAHPDDQRYKSLIGSTVVSPVFEVEVPIVAHQLAQPDKGSGVAMICTFGDTTDVTWWRELQLPTRVIVERNGRLKADTPDWIESAAGRAAYAELAGKTVKQAQAQVVDLLRQAAELDGEPKPITHAVKFYEKGDRPLEIVGSRQWYIRNGGRDPELRATFEHRGRELAWHPPSMRQRYESWVEGLNGDWLISRQRFFGVPFPLWYPIGADGSIDHDHPIIPAEDDLPVDPSSDAPPGYRPDQRGCPGGFAGDPDVMDTWATSSLTPQIACGWVDDDDLFGRTFPADLRPQGPEIVRTWLFDSVVRAHFEHGTLPWGHAMINGWILDPDRKKMSKSRGNVVTPLDVLEEHGSDAVRYWACAARPGTDTALDLNQFKIGRRLAIKMLNASRFALGLGEPGAAASVTEPIDLALLARLSEVVAATTEAFEGYDYARALERTETFFWSFCDDYLELVKGRAYGSGEEAASACRTLRLALAVLQRLFAPVLPFVAEEVWSWWQAGSVHRATWPDGAELGEVGDAAVLDMASDLLGAIRRAKTEAKRSMKAPVVALRVAGPAAALELVRAAEADVREAGNIAAVEYADAPELSVDVELADEPAA
ncbi:MAG TPA: valine--tRNA ligase [Acidimicrobiales bacterium]